MLKSQSVSPADRWDPKETDYLMACQGWRIFDGALNSNDLASLRADLDASYTKRREIQVANGIGDTMSGTCHHLLGDNNSLDMFMAGLPLHDDIRRFFGGAYILNSFGAVLNTPNERAYVGNIHRDVRTYSKDFRLLLNMLVMLDDFTTENGATNFLSGSHHIEAAPPESMFFKNATRAFGKAGDILLFDSRVWHAAGVNRSQSTRRGLTLTFSRAFFKQQIDYPKYLGESYVKNCSAELRQVLGYDARMAASLDEFYQPPEKRTYKPGQG